MSKEEMRPGFEAWHCEQYKTKHMTGAPTRDMHSGMLDENYCSKKSQALWECWQSTGGDVAKVEALKDGIELIEAGKLPVAVLYKDGTVLTKEECGTAFDVCCKVETPLFTRSDAGEVERLSAIVEQQKSLIASLRAELRESYGIDAAVQEEHLDLDAAAKKLAACMDYPWEHMPEQGRDSMRAHAKAVIEAAGAGSVEVERWKANAKNMQAQLSCALETSNARFLEVEALRAHLAEILDCPYVLEEATIPKGGIEVAPNQVVGTMHISLGRMRKLRAALSASAEPASKESAQ